MSFMPVIFYAIKTFRIREARQSVHKHCERKHVASRNALLMVQMQAGDGQVRLHLGVMWNTLLDLLEYLLDL